MYKNHEDLIQNGTFWGVITFNDYRRASQPVTFNRNGSGEIHMDIFVALLVVGCIVLFALMSLPVVNSDSLDEKRPTQPFK